MLSMRQKYVIQRCYKNQVFTDIKAYSQSSGTVYNVVNLAHFRYYLKLHITYTAYFYKVVNSISPYRGWLTTSRGRLSWNKDPYFPGRWMNSPATLCSLQDWIMIERLFYSMWTPLPLAAICSPFIQLEERGVVVLAISNTSESFQDIF